MSRAGLPSAAGQNLTHLEAEDEGGREGLAFQSDISEWELSVVMTTLRVAPEEEAEVSESIYCCCTDSERHDELSVTLNAPRNSPSFNHLKEAKKKKKNTGELNV